MNLASKRIMLTGGAGFLGSFVTEKLKARGCKDIFIPKFAPIPFTAMPVPHKRYAQQAAKEEDLWNGYPEETNAPYGLAAPEFAEVGNHFLVTVYKERISGLVQVPGKGLVRVPEKVTVNQARILLELTANSRITAKELASTIGISARKIKVNLSKLKAKGFVKRIGPDKGGHWEVLPK